MIQRSQLLSMLHILNDNSLRRSILGLICKSSRSLTFHVPGLAVPTDGILGRVEPVECVETLTTCGVAWTSSAKLCRNEGSAATIRVTLALGAAREANPLSASVETSGERHANRATVAVVKEGSAAADRVTVAANIDVLSEDSRNEERGGSKDLGGEHFGKLMSWFVIKE